MCANLGDFGVLFGSTRTENGEPPLNFLFSDAPPAERSGGASINVDFATIKRKLVMERIEIQFRVELRRDRLNGGKVALLVGDFMVESPSPDFPLHRSRFYLVGIVKRLTLRDAIHSAKPRGWAQQAGS